MYLGSLLHFDLPEHLDIEARLKKAPQVFGALRSKIFRSRDIPEQSLRGKDLPGSALAVLLNGCESRCLMTV